MKLFVVLDNEGAIQAICEKEDNAEAKIPSGKRHKKTQQKDRSWSYGYSNPWAVRHLTVKGNQVPGVKPQFVYATQEPLSLNFERAEGRQEIRILDENGLWVQEAQ